MAIRTIVFAMAAAAFFMNCRGDDGGKKRPDAANPADAGADAGLDAGRDAATPDADAAVQREDGSIPDGGADAAVSDPYTPADGGDYVRQNTPPRAVVTTPQDEVSGRVAIEYRLFDEDSDRLNIKAEYSTDWGGSFMQASGAGQGTQTTGLSSSPGGQTHSFVWDTVADLGKRTLNGIVFKIAPSDAAQGQAGMTSSFTVSNPMRFRRASQNDFPAAQAAAASAAFGDVDGDGDVDVAIGFRGQTRLYLNNGQGTFADLTDLNLPAMDDETQSVAFLDIEGDLDLDLVLGNSNSQSRLLVNDGYGGFTDETARRLPARSDQVEEVLAGDVDRNGKPDLFFLCSGSQQNRLYINDGDGFFADATAGKLPIDSTMTASGALADFDGTRGPDLLFSNFITSQGTRLWLNDGNGGFTDATAERLPRFDDGIPMFAAAGDIDADYDLDFIEVNALGLNRVLRNTGSGFFEYFGSANPPNAVTAGVAGILADFDLDGAADFFLVTSTTNPSTNPDMLFLNTGRGRFVQAAGDVFQDEDGRDGRAAAAADVDGDGDLDVIVANDSGGSVLWLNE